MIALIAAISTNNCIGKDNTLPWHIPEDLKHFKEITTGHSVLMGRNTWESIPDKFRPLPNRHNIIITSDKDYALPEGVEKHTSLDEALTAYKDKDVYVIGGASIYKQTIDRADQLYITEVHKMVDGDTFFPEIDTHMWQEVEREKHDGFSFVVYKKK